MVGCGLLSLAYLLTASPLAAVGGHILLHTALNLRGTEMPSYATGGAHLVPLGHQWPTAKAATAGPIRKPDQPSKGSGDQDYRESRPAVATVRDDSPLGDWSGRAELAS
jgi:hypothetical protein